MDLTITGLDLSLTSTGVACMQGGTFATWSLKPGKRRGYERLEWITDQVLISADDTDVIAVEWLAFGAQGDAVLELAGLWYVVTLALWKAGHVLVRVPPSVLKKYATGKGNAGKDEMLAAAVRRFPGSFTSNDAADALWLANAAAGHYAVPAAEIPKVQIAALYALRPSGRRKGLPAVEWPELPAEGMHHATHATPAVRTEGDDLRCHASTGAGRPVCNH